MLDDVYKYNSGIPRSRSFRKWLAVVVAAAWRYRRHNIMKQSIFHTKVHKTRANMACMIQQLCRSFALNHIYETVAVVVSGCACASRDPRGTLYIWENNIIQSTRNACHYRSIPYVHGFSENPITREGRMNGFLFASNLLTWPTTSSKGRRA